MPLAWPPPQPRLGQEGQVSWPVPGSDSRLPGKKAELGLLRQPDLCPGLIPGSVTVTTAWMLSAPGSWRRSRGAGGCRDIGGSVSLPLIPTTSPASRYSFKSISLGPSSSSSFLFFYPSPKISAFSFPRFLNMVMYSIGTYDCNCQKSPGHKRGFVGSCN